MSAVDEIQTAIEKLTKLRDESTQGPWRGHQNILGVTRIRNEVGFIIAVTYGPYGNEEEDTANADLIVTLHATIDAQLAILGDSVKHTMHGEYVDENFGEYGLTLARAINATS